MPVEMENPVAAAPAAPALQWQRLALLRGQMEANCAALAARDPALAERLRAFRPNVEWVLAVRGNDVILAELTGDRAHVRPCLLSAEAAHQTLAKVYPGGSYKEPLLVAGVDQG